MPKIKVEKAEKELGFRHLAHMMNLRLSSIHNKLPPVAVNESLSNEIKKAEKDWDLYQKPGFRKRRNIKIVPSLPDSPRDDIIYVTFKGRDGYAMRSGRNFIHSPVIGYGNLRYVSISELEYSKKEVLADLKKLNNGMILK